MVTGTNVLNDILILKGPVHVNALVLIFKQNENEWYQHVRGNNESHSTRIEMSIVLVNLPVFRLRDDILQHV